MEEIESTITYLALGDSYTKGEGVIEDDNFPNQLKQRLQVNHIHVKKLTVLAETGWTTTTLLQAINSSTPDSSYDLITLLIGVNNQYKQFDVSTYRTEFDKLLVKAIQLAGNRPHRVLVLSIPDYSVTPFAQFLNPMLIQQEIDLYNSINKEISEKYEVAYLNVTTISRKAEEDLIYLAPDELHPSSHMYMEWIDIIYPRVKELLK
jgi:lysophospholipase L1-like esterase